MNVRSHFCQYWKPLVLLIWGFVLLLISSPPPALELRAFRYLPVDASGVPLAGSSWENSPYPNKNTGAKDGFLFELVINVEEVSDLGFLKIHVDDLLASLSLNNHPIVSNEHLDNGPLLSQRFHDGLLEFGKQGANQLSGYVINSGGPSHITIAPNRYERYGSRNMFFFFWVSVTALIIWIVVHKPHRAPSIPVTIAIICLMILIFFRGMITQLYNFGRDDWDQHFWFVEAGRRALFDYHTWPLWNPYSDGGIPLLGYPQNPSLSPFFFLSGIFGSLVGPKLTVLIHAVIGMLGAFKLGRLLGLRWEAAFLTSILFQFNGAIVQHIGEGHFGHQGFNFIPWSLFFFFKSRYRLNWHLIAASVCYAIVNLNGSLYEVVFYALSLSLWCFFEGIRRRSVKPLGALFWLLLLFLAFSAPKALASYDYSSLCARLGNSNGGYNLLIFWESLIREEPPRWYPGQVFFWHEYCSYVDVLVLFFAAFGMALSLRTSWPALASLAVNICITFSDNMPMNVWTVLDTIPFLNSLLGPSRWNYVTMFYIAWYAGKGLDLFCEKFPRSGYFLPCAVYLLQLYALSPVYEKAFDRVPAPLWREGPYRLITNSSTDHPERYSALYEVIQGNVGVINSYNPVAPERYSKGEDHPDYRGLVFLEESSGTAEIIKWSPRSLTVQVETDQPGVLVYNQNYFPGWYAYRKETREKAFPLNGLVATRLEPGKTTVVLSYFPVLFLCGLGISVTAILTTFSYWLWGFSRLRHRKRHGRK